MSWQFQPLLDLFEQSPCWTTSPSPAKEPKGLLYLSFSTEGNGWGAVDPLSLKHEYLIASLSQKSPTLSHQELTAFRGREGNYVFTYSSRRWGNWGSVKSACFPRLDFAQSSCLISMWDSAQPLKGWRQHELWSLFLSGQCLGKLNSVDKTRTIENLSVNIWSQDYVEL